MYDKWDIEYYQKEVQRWLLIRKSKFSIWVPTKDHGFKHEIRPFTWRSFLSNSALHSIHPLFRFFYWLSEYIISKSYHIPLVRLTLDLRIWYCCWMFHRIDLEKSVIVVKNRWHFFFLDSTQTKYERIEIGKCFCISSD